MNNEQSERRTPKAQDLFLTFSNLFEKLEMKSLIKHVSATAAAVVLNIGGCLACRYKQRGNFSIRYSWELRIIAAVECFAKPFHFSRLHWNQNMTF